MGLDDVQTTETLSWQSVIQGTIRTVMEPSLRPREAAIALVRLKALLEPLAEMDEDFEEEWGAIMEGDFESQVAGSTLAIPQEAVLDAMRAFTGLLNRAGMGVALERISSIAQRAGAIRAFMADSLIGRGAMPNPEFPEDDVAEAYPLAKPFEGGVMLG